MKVSNIALIVVSFTLLIFTLVMIATFFKMGAIPDTLVTCVFGACTGELGILGWIKNTKVKNSNEEDAEDEIDA